MIPFKYIRFLAEGYQDRLKQKGVSGETLRYLESLKPADKGKAIAKLMSNPKLEIDDLKDEDIRVKNRSDNLAILDADPTVDHQRSITPNTPPGDYYRVIKQWWYDENSIRLPEDESRVYEVLQYYNENKNRFRTKYVSKYRKFQELEQEYLRVSEQKTERQRIRDIKLEGSKKLFDGSEWLLYEITSKEAACYYGKGTRWCTAADKHNQADAYLRNGPLYIFINKKTDSKYQANHDFSYFLDEEDRELLGWGYDLSTTDERLDLIEFAMLHFEKYDAIVDNIFESYDQYLRDNSNPKRFSNPKVEKIALHNSHIRTSSRVRYIFTHKIKVSADMEGYLASEKGYAFEYAHKVLGGRFIEGEKTIFSYEENPNMSMALYYIRYIIKGAFEPFEKLANEYIQNFAKLSNDDILREITEYYMDYGKKRMDPEIEKIVFENPLLLKIFKRHSYFHHFNIDTTEQFKNMFDKQSIHDVAYYITSYDGSRGPEIVEYFLEMLTDQKRLQEIVDSRDPVHASNRIVGWLKRQDIHIPEYLDYMKKNHMELAAYYLILQEMRDKDFEKKYFITKFGGVGLLHDYYNACINGYDKKEYTIRWKEMEDFYFNNPPVNISGDHTYNFFVDYSIAHDIDLPKSFVLHMEPYEAAKYYVGVEKRCPFPETEEEILNSPDHKSTMYQVMFKNEINGI